MIPHNGLCRVPSDFIITLISTRGCRICFSASKELNMPVNHANDPNNNHYVFNASAAIPVLSASAGSSSDSS